ncbi:MAG: hypothetical protein V7K26_00075 [Nostoc sp.]|uniref:hypothetical protein n=1 Tax=Nostoc sp. TaxID=1180 RepID=UPI002FF06069
MPNWNGSPIPSSPQVKIPNSIPQNFNWGSYAADPKGTFNKFKGAREVNRINWKGYKTASASAKRIILSSPSKKFISDAMKQVKSLRQARKIADNAKKTADAVKKTSDIVAKVQEVMFKNVPGSAVLDKASRVGGILGIFAAIGVVALVKLQEFMGDRIFDDLLTTQIDLTKINTIAVDNGLKLKKFDIKIQKFEKELNANAKDYYQLNKQTESLAKGVIETKKQSNEALYETRQGRKIVTGLAEAARKVGNDALYEARQNKQSLEKEITGLRANFETKIQTVNTQFSKLGSNIVSTVQKTVNTTISKIQSDLKSETEATRKYVDRVLVPRVEAVATQSTGVTGEMAKIKTYVERTFATITQSTGQVAETANNANTESKNTKTYVERVLVPRIDATVKTFEGTAGGLSETYQRSYEAQAVKWNADLSKLQGKVGDIETVTTSSSYKNPTIELTKELNLLKADIPKIKTDIQSNATAITQISNQGIPNLKNDVEINKKEIAKVDEKVKEQEKVNALALPKLDQILGILPFIPARAAAAIKPDIPTIPQIEAAAATGTCRTTQPGGCMSKALNDNANQITNNNNSNAANILGAVNAVGQGADLALLGVINNKLGDQLPGGIGGKLSRFADWMHLDRVLNVMILGATIHNALMLSNDIGQTLIGALNNVLQLIGLKKEDGSTFDIGSVISSSIENLIKSAIGADNYVELKASWQKANRIYQATINIFNSLQGLSSAILTGLEMTAGKVGKIGNALRSSGEVSESAYSWMNPQPKFNRITQGLESLQNGASTIQMVTQAPLDVLAAITETTNATTEFVKAIKEDDKPENKGKESPEPNVLKLEKATSKTASAGLDLSDIDFDIDIEDLA